MRQTYNISCNKTGCAKTPLKVEHKNSLYYPSFVLGFVRINLKLKLNESSGAELPQKITEIPVRPSVPKKKPL